MNRYLVLLAVVCVGFTSLSAQKKPTKKTKAPAKAVLPLPVQYREILLNTSQAVVVTTPNWNAVDGSLQRYEKNQDKWQKVGNPVPIVVGKNGLAWDALIQIPATHDPVKTEGDGRSPAGIFKLSQLFGFEPALPETQIPYLPLTEYTECVDDPSSHAYNQIVNRQQTPYADWNSSEKMRTIDGYKLGVVVDYNSQNIQGDGSCIFMHIWNGAGKGTAGCTAMQEAQLQEITQWLEATKNPVLIQFPAPVYNGIRPAWQLP